MRVMCRDALALSNYRIKLVLTEDRPQLVTVHRDDAVVSRASYNSQPPAIVADEVAYGVPNGSAARWGSVPADGWDARRGQRVIPA